MVQHSGRLRASAVAAVFLISAALVFADDKLTELVESGSYEKAIEYAEKKLPADSRTVTVWVDMAHAYRKTGNDQKALSALKAAQKINPSEPVIFTAYGDYYHFKKQYSDALQMYQKSYLLNRSAKAVEGIALSAAKLKEWDKARDAAESAVNLDSTLYEPRLILIDLYLKDADYQAAAAQLEFVVTRPNASVSTWKQLALCYDSTGNKEGLARADAKIVALDKKAVDARHRLATYSLSKKKVERAYELYKEIAVLTPEDSRPFEQLYKIAKDKNDHKDATLYLKNYLVLDSTHAQYHKQLGDLLFIQKDADGALEAYRKALRHDSKLTGLYKNYSSILIDKKLEDEAVRVINNAIAVKEADAAMLIALGDIYKRRKDFANSIKTYQAALDKDTKNVSLLASLAQSQALAGDHKNAAGSYEQVVLLNADANDEYKQLGLLHVKLGKKDNAMQAFKKYLAKTPGDNEIARTVGLYEHDKKQYSEAVKYLTMVKDAGFHTVEYRTALGDSYYNLELWKQASEQYAKIVAKNPQEDVLKNVLKPLGISYENIGMSMEASKVYDQYVRMAGVDDKDVAYKRAHLREKSDKVGALKLYAQNIAAYPRDHRNFLRLGLNYADGQSTLSKSAEMLEKASLLVDSLPEVWKTLGEVYGKLNNVDKELHAYKKLLALQPRDVSANKRVGLILLEKGETSSAIASLEIAQMGPAKDEEILLALGDGYMKTKRPKEASQALIKARDLKAGDVSIRLALIDALLAAGLKDEAAKERESLAVLDKSIVEKDKKNIESRRRLAQYSLEKEDLNTAYALFTDLSTLTPQDSVVFKRLYMIAAKNNKNNEAVGHLKKYISLDSTNSGAYKSLGNLLYEKKDMDGALDAYRRAVKLNPKETGLYKNYIDIVLKKNLETEAVKTITGAIAVGEADAPSYIALADIHKKQKKWADAIEMYQKALKTETGNMKVLTSLAQCQAAAGDTKSAVITYEQVVLINQHASSEYKALGDLHMLLKNEQKAIDSYKSYLSKDSKNSAVARVVGLYEYDRKNYKDAIQYLNLVTDDKHHDVDYYSSIGLAYYHTGKYKEAAEKLRRVGDLKPSAAIQRETLRALAQAYEKVNKSVEAADAYQAYTQLAGVRDEDASFKKAFLREKANKDQAVKTYVANTRLFPKDHRNFLRLGLIYSEDQKQLKQSAGMLSKAAELVDTMPVIWRTLGRVHGKLENESGELQAYKKLLSLNPQDLEANKRVGTIRLKQGQTSAALVNLESALTAAPNDIEVMLLLSQGYETTNRPKQAIELLVKAGKNQEKNADIRMQLYKLYKQIGQEKKAEEEISRLIALTSENQYRRIYALDLIEKKRHDEAMKQVGAIRDSEPMNIDGLMLLASIQQAQEKLAEAIETYKMISYVNDSYVPAITARGDVYLKQNELSRAKEYYDKALKIDAKYAPAELGLARVAKVKKDVASYQRHLNKAKTLDPKNRDVLLELKSTNN